jgi:hypothetical protein
VTIRNRAAAWVATQVSRAVTLSCDPVMCRTLEAHGIPTTALLVLRRGDADPLRSKVIVVTAAVRSIVGSRFITADAPAAIASFGSGNMQVSVRVIFPQGAAAYSSALREDTAARKEAGIGLLQYQRITASATARWQLEGGHVDSRLVLTIAELASQWQVSIVAFDRAPGASPGIPLRSADLVQTGARPTPKAAQVQLMRSFLQKQGWIYPEAYIQMVRLAGGRNALRIGFAAPSPLGSISPPIR